MSTIATLADIVRVRLMHAQHVLHRLAGDADFFADDSLTRTQTTPQESQRNRIGVIDMKVKAARAQRGHRTPLDQGTI